MLKDAPALLLDQLAAGMPALQGYEPPDLENWASELQVTGASWETEPELAFLRPGRATPGGQSLCPAGSAVPDSCGHADSCTSLSFSILLACGSGTLSNNNMHLFGWW